MSTSKNINSKFFCTLIVFLTIIITGCKNKNKEMLSSSYPSTELLDSTLVVCKGKIIDIGKLPIESVDRKNYEEGFIQTITTKDSSIIILNCLHNTESNLLTKKRYVTLDSILISDNYYSYRGIDTVNGKYWRRDGNVSYIHVKPQDTAKYNRIFDDINFIKHRK